MTDNILIDGYSPRLKRKAMIDISTAKLYKMSNGRKRLSGVATEDPDAKISRLLSNADAERLEAVLGPAREPEDD